MELKQQLELMKMCGRVNSNPTLKHNPSFNLLVSKCVGVAPTGNNTRPTDDKSLWDNMKDDYKKENPDLTLICLLYTSPSPRDSDSSRMPSSA